MNRKFKDYYQILGVEEKAKAQQIRAAYRKLARRYHPDANPGDKAAEEKFKEISEAYDVLSNKKKRQEYDQLRQYMSSGGGRGGGAQGYSAEDFSKIFGAQAGAGFGGFQDLFDLFGGGGGGAAAPPPQKGRDLHYNVHISFENALNGVTTRLNLNREGVCEVCGGSGAAPGTSPVPCPHCGGRGSIAQNQGFFSLSRTCPNCLGRGTVVQSPCPNCRATGRATRSGKLTVKIPPGVHDGSKIKIRGKGEDGLGGGPPGDLYVITKVAPDQLFKLDGSDIRLEAPISITEAALGATVKVPTTKGKVALKIPAGTQEGKVFRLKGRGAPKLKGFGQGDMLVTVRVRVPEKLSAKEKEILGRFAEAHKEDLRRW